VTAQQIKEMLTLLAAIEAKLGHIEEMLARISDDLYEAAVEWAEPLPRP
jgi:hypothetical protein